jgi:hypothetical protein
MSAGEGPFGPGLRRGAGLENRSRHFLSTNALWNLNSVAGWMNAPHLRDPARPQEQRAQPEDQAIEGGQIRRPMSGAIADQQLMFEQQRLCSEGADPTRRQKFGNGDKQVNGEDQQSAHARTLPWLPLDARLPGTGGFRHTIISLPTGLLREARTIEDKPDLVAPTEGQKLMADYGSLGRTFRESKGMSEAIERLAAFLQLSDDMLVRAERGDLKECVRVLAVHCAHYQSKFGKLPVSDTRVVLFTLS